MSKINCAADGSASFPFRLEEAEAEATFDLSSSAFVFDFLSELEAAVDDEDEEEEEEAADVFFESFVILLSVFWLFDVFVFGLNVDEKTFIGAHSSLRGT